MYYLLGFVALLTVVVKGINWLKSRCFGDTIPVSQTGSVIINLDRLPSNLSAGFVDVAAPAPSCAYGYDDSVLVELLSTADGYAAKISWNVMNPRMLTYKICGCGKKS